MSHLLGERGTCYFFAARSCLEKRWHVPIFRAKIRAPRGQQRSDTMNAKRTRHLDRRTFLGTSALAAAGLAVAPFAFAQDIRRGRPTGAVATAAGRIRGVTLENGVNAFYGVPYGAST